MKQFTEEESKKLLLAGKACWEDLLLEAEVAPASEEEAAAAERLWQAEREAWARLRRQQRRARQRRWALAAACLLLALGAVLLSGKPSVAYQKLWNHLFVKDNGGTSVSIVSSSTVLLPENWSGCYLPMDIPQGYEIESAEASRSSQNIFYSNEQGDYIDFYVSIGDFNVHLDTENCDIEKVQIGECEGMIRTKYKNGEILCVTINWIEDDKFFDIGANAVSPEALLDIAESIMIAE